VHIHFDVSFKQSIMTFNSKRIDIDAQFTTYNVGDFMNNAHIIYADNTHPGKECNVFVFGPLCFYHTVAVVGKQPGSIGAIGAVNF